MARGARAADKHLAVTWEDAKWIYDTGKELGLVHMAGSSVPPRHD